MSNPAEHLKLFAAWANITAGGTITAGIVAPGIAEILGQPIKNQDLAIWVPVVCFFVAIAIHLLGQLVLTWIPEESDDQ